MKLNFTESIWTEFLIKTKNTKHIRYIDQIYLETKFVVSANFHVGSLLFTHGTQPNFLFKKLQSLKDIRSNFYQETKPIVSAKFHVGSTLFTNGTHTNFWQKKTTKDKIIKRRSPFFSFNFCMEQNWVFDSRKLMRLKRRYIEREVRISCSQLSGTIGRHIILNNCVKPPLYQTYVCSSTPLFEYRVR